MSKISHISLAAAFFDAEGKNVQALSVAVSRAIEQADSSTLKATFFPSVADATCSQEKKAA